MHYNPANETNPTTETVSISWLVWGPEPQFEKLKCRWFQDGEHWINGGSVPLLYGAGSSVHVGN